MRTIKCRTCGVVQGDEGASEDGAMWSTCDKCMGSAGPPLRVFTSCPDCEDPGQCETEGCVAGSELLAKLEEVRSALAMCDAAMNLALRHFNASCSRCDDGILECECTCLSMPDAGEICHRLDEAQRFARRLLAP